MEKISCLKNRAANPNRVIAGYKAKYSRVANQARCELWQCFKVHSAKQTGFIPRILPYSEGGVELIYDRGYGLVCLKFQSWREALDWIVSLC